MTLVALIPCKIPRLSYNQTLALLIARHRPWRRSFILRSKFAKFISSFEVIDNCEFMLAISGLDYLETVTPTVMRGYRSELHVQKSKMQIL